VGVVDDDVLAGLDEEERAGRWAGMLADTDALVAQDARGVAGFTALAVPARELDETGVGEITALYVDPPRWRGGVGRALIDAAGAELRDEGCDVVVLWTFEASEPSRAFYAALGFEPDGARSRHQRAGVDEIRLRARLD
jgi:GNAT superfamily N-acetyltransferase